MKRIFVIALLVSTAAFSADTRLGIQSAILPGMGQVAAGAGKITDLNTVKGLGIMAGFIVCMNGLVSSISSYDSYAEETRVVRQNYNNASFKSEKDSLYERWSAAWDNADGAKTAVAVFTGLTAAVYAYGIVDALMFTHVREKKGEGQSSGKAGRPEIRLSGLSGRQGVEVMVRF
jgi:hypothetical protein